MKTIKLALAAAALCMSVSAFSQTDTTTHKKDTTTRKTDTTSAQMQNQAFGAGSDQAQNGGTSITSSSPKPNFGRYYIPVLGTYQSSQAAESTSQPAAQSVTVTPDETNAGKVWVEGLTPTKFYALLKSAPATYKVPAQKQDKTSLQEGTITYDESTKQISICLGCGFTVNSATESNATDTETTTATPAKNKKAAKAKTTVINFTGTKTGEATAGIQ